MKFIIIDFFDYSDTYYIGIIKKIHVSKLKKIEFPNNSYIRKFGDTRNKEILYAIDCGKCDMSNLWQLGIEENPPSEGHCNDCGTNLFDKLGNPIYEMEKIHVP